MNTSFCVVQKYDSRGLPELSMTAREGGTIQVVYAHSHPKSINNIGWLSIEKSQELLNKILQDLNYFKKFLDSSNEILRSTVKRDIADDLQLGKALYSRYLNLIKKSGINSQFEKAPNAIFEEIDMALKMASLPILVVFDDVATTHRIEDEEESESNSWGFGFRLDKPNLSPRVENRGRKRKRPVVTFFPRKEKRVVEEVEQQLPTPRTPPQIPLKPMASFRAQEQAF